jgi:hypothetical protein
MKSSHSDRGALTPFSDANPQSAVSRVAVCPFRRATEPAIYLGENRRSNLAASGPYTTLLKGRIW